MAEYCSVAERTIVQEKRFASDPDRGNTSRPFVLSKLHDYTIKDLSLELSEVTALRSDIYSSLKALRVLVLGRNGCCRERMKLNLNEARNLNL